MDIVYTLVYTYTQYLHQIFHFKYFKNKGNEIHLKTSLQINRLGTFSDIKTMKRRGIHLKLQNTVMRGV